MNEDHDPANLELVPFDPETKHTFRERRRAQQRARVEAARMENQEGLQQAQGEAVATNGQNAVIMADDRDQDI